MKLRGRMSGGGGATGNVRNPMKGLDGLSAYEIWLKDGNAGSEQDFLNSLQGRDGESAYQLWLAAGNVGTVEDFLESLKADDYILTEDDKKEIAQKAAEMVEIPEIPDVPEGVATEDWVKEYAQPKGEYISKEQLEEAVADAVKDLDVDVDLSGLATKQELDKVEEKIPDVPEWAKQPSKPSYSKSEVGLGNVDNVKQYSASNPPPYPVRRVNGRTGDVEVEPKGTGEQKVAEHNTSEEAHNDIRLVLGNLINKVNTLLDSDDTTLDQTKEIVAYIKANRELLESVTTNKVNVADIIDNLTTSVSNKPLSAKQGVQLKSLIDAIKVPTKLSEFNDDVGYMKNSEQQSVIDAALEQAKASGEFDGVDGQRGTGILNTTTGIQSYTTTVDGIKPTYRILLSTLKTQAKVNDVLIGDIVRYSTFIYPIIHVDDTYAYMGAGVSLQGSPGASVTVKSVSESTESGGSNVVTFSDGKTVTIKNGSKGSPGTPGKDGVDGVDGKDYVLKASDKTEIAEMVEGATIVQAPKYVNSVDEMTDTDRPYVLISTGHIWANAETTVETEGTVTDTITATDDNPYVDGSRLGSSGDAMNNDAGGYHITPLIDLTKPKYQGKRIQIHLEGAQYASTGAYATYIQCRAYGLDKATLMARPYTVDVSIGGSGLVEVTNGTISVEYKSATSAVITIDVPPTYGSGKVAIGYLRFCGKGAIANSKISITYTDKITTTGVQWFDTGTSYAPTLTAEDKAEIAEDVAEMIDTQLLSIIGEGSVTL